MTENHGPPAAPKPQVFYKPTKIRHTSSAATPRRRQPTLLAYSADPRQRHDASVELVPGLALPPPPPSRFAQGSTRRSAGAGKADVGQRKLTEFGVGGKKKKEERGEVLAASGALAAHVKADQVVVRGRGPEWTGDIGIGEDWASRDKVPGSGSGSGGGCLDVVQAADDDRSEQGDVAWDLSNANPASRFMPARDAIDSRALSTTSPTLDDRPVSLLAPPRPPQRAPSLLLADLPAAPQYFEILPRLPCYPPTPPRTEVSASPHTVEHEQPALDRPPDPVQDDVEVGSAQQRIDLARAQRRPVTLAMILDVWREQLAVEQGKEADSSRENRG